MPKIVENMNIEVAAGSSRCISVRLVTAAGAPVTDPVVVELALKAPLTGELSIILATASEGGVYNVALPSDLVSPMHPGTGESIPWHYALLAGEKGDPCLRAFLSGELQVLPAALASELASDIAVVAVYNSDKGSADYAVIPSAVAALPGVSEQQLVDMGVLTVPTQEVLEVWYTAPLPATGSVEGGSFKTAIRIGDCVFNAVRIYGSTTVNAELQLRVTRRSSTVSSVRCVKEEDGYLFYFEEPIELSFVKEFAIFSVEGALIKFSWSTTSTKPNWLGNGVLTGGGEGVYPLLDLCNWHTEELPTTAAVTKAEVEALNKLDTKGKSRVWLYLSKTQFFGAGFEISFTHDMTGISGTWYDVVAATNANMAICVFDQEVDASFALDWINGIFFSANMFVYDEIAIVSI